MKNKERNTSLTTYYNEIYGGNPKTVHDQKVATWLRTFKGMNSAFQWNMLNAAFRFAEGHVTSPDSFVNKTMLELVSILVCGGEVLTDEVCASAALSDATIETFLSTNCIAVL
jgi:hypothetical protein